VNGEVTTFTMDLNSGLTQTLADGDSAYLYGVGRVSQQRQGRQKPMGGGQFSQHGFHFPRVRQKQPGRLDSF
jgi:hypothetical protein